MNKKKKKMMMMMMMMTMMIKTKTTSVVGLFLLSVTLSRLTLNNVLSTSGTQNFVLFRLPHVTYGGFQMTTDSNNP